MTIEALACRAERALLKRPQTAGEIASRMKGGYTGRGIAKALHLLVGDGLVVVAGSRRPRYSRP